MSPVEINKKIYQVLEDEFKIIPNLKYPVLKLSEKVGYYERISSLINELSSIGKLEKVLFINPTHGGFMPIQCSNSFKFTDIYAYFDNKYDFLDGEKNKLHQENILINCKTHNIDNIHIIEKYTNISYENDKNQSQPIIIAECDKSDIDLFNLTLNKNNLPIIIAKKTNLVDYNHIYSIFNTELCLYIPDNFYSLFCREFYYFMDVKERTLYYNNLIHLCIMVKNAGPQFEQMLVKNMHVIDRWTILDTGSTDGTIDIINKVLVGKKKGNLYQEPFINFRDSRNRCLDLAGMDCKYTLMLDDTYIIEGNLRGFLNMARDDQFADTLSLYVKSHDVEYTSNRLLKTDKHLRYIYRLHEIINDKNNLNIMIPIEEAKINDYTCDYMTTRTNGRKEYDLRILLEDAQEDPENSRHYYYIAQTYNLLHRHELAYEYFLKRAYHENKGYIQERVDSLFEAARIAKYKLNFPWEKCLELYNECFELDKTRPDVPYFIGMHYYFQGEMEKAFSFFKLAFHIGYPHHCQFSLKPTLSFYFLPLYIAELCYPFKEFALGLSACKLFLQHNNDDADNYKIIVSWNAIYQHLCRNASQSHTCYKPIISYMAILELTTSIETTTKANELAENMSHQYQVIFFSLSREERIKKGIIYLNISKYYDFISENIVHTAIIYNLTEFLPVSYCSNIEKVFLYICDSKEPSDVLKNGVIIPVHPKLQNILCYSQLDLDNFTSIFANLREKIHIIDEL